MEKLATTYVRLADNHFARKHFDPAVELYQQALQLRTALKLSPILIAKPNILIGNAYAYKKQYATAKTFFSIAKDTLVGVADAAEMLVDLEEKIAMCSAGNLNIVPVTTNDNTADIADAGATMRNQLASDITREISEVTAELVEVANSLDATSSISTGRVPPNMESNSTTLASTDLVGDVAQNTGRRTRAVASKLASVITTHTVVFLLP